MKLPLLEEEVRGIDSLKQFSANLIKPYRPASAPSEDNRYVLVKSELGVTQIEHG